jgi:predicted RNA-binding protein with PUA-like domain
MNYWLVKQEPEAYSFDDLIKDGKTDKVLFYHSVSEKSVVGLAEVSRAEFPDPLDEKWIAVEIKPVEKLSKPVSLEQIKAEKSLENVALIKHSRLSVMPLAKNEFETILKIANS